MELFVAGLVLGVLLGLCLGGRRAADDGDPLAHGRRLGGAKGVRPAQPASPYPPRPTPRARLRNGLIGYQPRDLPPVDWANVQRPTGGSAVKPPPPQVIRIEHTETGG